MGASPPRLKPKLLGARELTWRALVARLYQFQETILLPTCRRFLLSTERCVRNENRGAGNSIPRPSTDAPRFLWTFGAAFQVDELISSFDHSITTSMFFVA